MKRKPRKMPLRANAPKLGDFIIEAAASFDIVEAKAGEAAKRPTFEIVAYNGDKMRPGGYYREVVIDLAGLESNSTIPILLDHDPTQIVGQANEVRIGNKSVTMSGIFTGDHTVAGEPAHKVASHAKNGLNWAASVGVAPGKTESISENQTVTVNGREFKGPILVVRTGRLGETSFVAIGADKTAGAKVAASAKGAPMNKQFEKWLKANDLFEGFEAMTEKAQAAIKAQYDAVQAAEAANEEEETPAPPPKKKKSILAGAVSLAERAEKTRARNERAKRIEEIAADWMAKCPNDVDEIEASAQASIEANEDPADFELYMHRNMRPNPAVGAPLKGGNKTVSASMVEAAICRLASLPNIEKHFKEDVLQASEDRFKAGLSMTDVLLMFAHPNGFKGYNYRDPELLKFAFAGDQRALLNAGFSTVDLPNVFSNVANKFLLEGWNGEENSWFDVAKTRGVRDFKTSTGFRLGADMKYLKIGRGGEIKHGTFNETAYTNKADTYARMVTIPREAIIDDDTGALTEAPMLSGAGAKEGFNEVFWTEFLEGNTDFYTTGRGNYATGATTVLSYDSLTAAETLFRKLKKPNNQPLGMRPRILLVPIELHDTAERLMGSGLLNEVQETTAGAGTSRTFGTTNPKGGRFKVVSSDFLSATAITGYSTTAWWLLADPKFLPVIEAVFLDNKMTPTIMRAELTGDRLGISMTGYHDFGVNKQEYRGGVKMKGAA